MVSIVQTWVQVCTLLQGTALLAVLGALIVCALRLHFLLHTRPAGSGDFAMPERNQP